MTRSTLHFEMIGEKTGIPNNTFGNSNEYFKNADLGKRAPMDPLEGVSVFVAVAEKGSFSAAAEKLACSKSTVSAQITRLEKRIGARLVRRSSRSVALTEAGKAYLCEIDEVLDRVRQAEIAAKARSTELTGPLRVSVPAPFAATHIARLLPDFLERHPRLNIELHVTAEVVDLVDSGFDLAIRLCPTDDPNSIVRRLGSTRLVVAAAPALLARKQPPREPDDLRAWPCFVNSIHPRKNEWRFRRGAEERRIVLDARLSANNHDVLTTLVLAGSGIGLLSEYAVTEQLRRKQLVRLLPDWKVADVPVLAVYPDNRQIAVKVRTFVDYLAKRLAQGSLVE